MFIFPTKNMNINQSYDESLLASIKSFVSLTTAPANLLRAALNEL